jgi:hypothetical protein
MIYQSLWYAVYNWWEKKEHLSHTFFIYTKNFIRLSVYCSDKENRIDGVMVSVLALSAVDRGFEPRPDQTKDYKIDICCFSSKHAVLRRKSKAWLAWN